MSLSGEPARSGTPRRPATFARELLSVLVGIEHAQVAEDASGAISGVRVWGTGEFPPSQLVRNIQTALRAHLDLKVEAERIHVMSGPPPTRPPVPKEALDAAIAKVLRSEPEAPSTPSAAPPSATAADRGALAPGSALSSPARSPSESAPRAASETQTEVADRIIYEGYEVVSHRSRESLLRVTLSWGDRQFIGQAHGTDDPREMAEALARATLKALEGIVHTRIRNAACSLELAGLQFNEAFGYQLVVSVVKLSLDGDPLPLSGSVVVRHGTGLAAILSVLQAADRRVRAILEGEVFAPPPSASPPPGTH